MFNLDIVVAAPAQRARASGRACVRAGVTLRGDVTPRGLPQMTILLIGETVDQSKRCPRPGSDV